MKKLLKFIIENIVEKPKEIKIKEEENNNEVVLTLKVASEDMGKIIGKKGKIIRAVRQLLRIKAFKLGKRVNLVLEESEKPIIEQKDSLSPPVRPQAEPEKS